MFPELDKLRSGDSLEARFNAFKIPESNFLVFEATVRTCREGCQPAYCPGQSGRSEPSFGRKRRSINGTLVVESTEELADTILENENSTNAVNVTGRLLDLCGSIRSSANFFVSIQHQQQPKTNKYSILIHRRIYRNMFEKWLKYSRQEMRSITILCPGSLSHLWVPFV